MWFGRPGSIPFAALFAGQLMLQCNSAKAATQQVVRFHFSNGSFQGVEGRFVIEENEGVVRLVDFGLRFKRPRGSFKSSFRLTGPEAVMRVAYVDNAVHPFSTEGYSAYVIRLWTSDDTPESSTNDLVQKILYYDKRREVALLAPDAFSGLNSSFAKTESRRLRTPKIFGGTPQALSPLHPEDVALVREPHSCERELVSPSKRARIATDIHRELGRPPR